MFWGVEKGCIRNKWVSKKTSNKIISELYHKGFSWNLILNFRINHSFMIAMKKYMGKGTLREKCPNLRDISLRIQSECGTIRTWKNFIFWHSHKVVYLGSCQTSNGSICENSSQLLGSLLTFWYKLLIL